jgi:hypothetical protein
MKSAELTQIALLGTERQGVSVPAPRTALGELESQVDVNQRERALLSLAALSGLHERIGILPARDNASLPQPCPTERQRPAGERAGSLLLRLLAGEFAELLPVWLTLAAREGLIALPEALPSLLDMGRSKPDLREAILPVLGERGRWLAAQNADWAWVSGAASEDEDLWHHGERPARLLFLQRLRRTNAGRARELLAETWKDEAAEDRATFIAAFEAGLTLEDEPFLEAALDDKRKEVRRNAAALLARLPHSALVHRMTERAKPLLRFVPWASGSVLKLKKGKPAAIEVTLPAECGKAMQRDGIEPKPQQGFGERAWWLIQLLEVAPLDLWAREWNSVPAEIVAAALRGEGTKELFEAWTRAAIRQQNATWAEALFGAALDGKRADKFEGLLAAMSPPQREARLAALLLENDKKARDLQPALIAQCRHDWSPGFSRAVLAFMRKESAQTSGDWALRNQFKDFAPRIARDVLTEAAVGWPTDSQGWAFWSKGVGEFLAVAQFRADVHNALSRSK